MSFRKLALAALLTCAATAAHAFPISSVVVYGDSLSDNGNLYKAIGYPPPPYFKGRFSNGPVAVEQLATAANVPLYDFAYGGATSGIGNYVDGGTQTTPGAYGLPGMKVELAASKASLSPAALSTALFVVWGGANDFFSLGSPDVAAANIDSIVTSLQALGAQHILVPGLPDLGLTPEFYKNAAASGFTAEFNQKLLAGLPKGATYFDTYSLLNAITANPAAYGLKDVTDPCFNSTAMTLCSNPNQYLFFDGVHPTTAADSILAAQFAAAAGVTPEPSSLILIGSGAAWLTALVRRRRA